MSELTLDKTLRLRDRGKKVRLVQEWLCLRGLGVKVDSDFGAATEFAVRQFQSKNSLAETGTVNPQSFERLTQPMRDCLKPASSTTSNVGRMVVAFARQHLRQKPREVGGQNRGPWVRLYMRGNEGDDFPWCAGFVSFVLKAACEQIGQDLPVKSTFSCDLLAQSGKDNDRFVPGGPNVDTQQLRPGSIFLVRKTSTDWTHTGIVTKVDEKVFLTIEGNTNDSGSREGYEVCQRVRGYRKVDFVQI